MEHTNFHDQSDNAELFDFQNASDCLQNCKALGTANDFNKYLQKNIKPNNQNFSVFFNNLDGNATNFDSISVELKKIGHKFLLLVSVRQTLIGVINLYTILTDMNQFTNQGCLGKVRAVVLGYILTRDLPMRNSQNSVYVLLTLKHCLSN